MVEAWFSLLQDIEAELSKGVRTTEHMERLGAKLNNRFARLSKAVKILEKDGWKWETNFKYLVFIKNTTERNAKKELKKAGVNMKLVRFNIPL